MLCPYLLGLSQDVGVHRRDNDQTGHHGLPLLCHGHVGLVDTASGRVLLAFADASRAQQMLAQHTAVEGEVPIEPEALAAALSAIRKQGYFERDSLQTYGLADISCPIFGPDNSALAALTCPYVRRIDSHVGPDQKAVRLLLQQAARALSLTQGGWAPPSRQA